MLTKRLRYLVVPCLALVMGGFNGTPLAPEALAASPASLMGESFSSVSGSFSGTCTSIRNGSFTYSTSDRAVGPYPGTFTESGSFTMANGRLTTFSATFTIISAAGGVSGSERLAVGSGSSASCSAGGPVRISGPVTYTATIDSAYEDTGTATVVVEGNTLPGLVAGEVFTISEGVVPSSTPSGS
jgi:hypothetical protein